MTYGALFPIQLMLLKPSSKSSLTDLKCSAFFSAALLHAARIRDETPCQTFSMDRICFRRKVAWE